MMTITNEAKSELESILEENQATGIRLFMAGIGWGGPQLGVALDEPLENDEVHSINSIKVAIDPKISKMVNGLVLDKKPQGLVLTGMPDNGC